MRTPALLLLLLPALATAAPIGLTEGVTWHADQIAAAGAGQRTIARIPLVLRANAADGDTPAWYIGTTPKTDDARGMWIAPRLSAHADPWPEKLPAAGMIVQADGFYTGRSEEFVWKAPDGAEQRYSMAEFFVQRWRPHRSTDPFVIRTLLDGPQALETPEQLTDARRWLVIAHTLDLRSKGCTQGAKIRRKRLIEKGFAETEIIDSRQAPRLGCCAKSVLIGRFETRAEAMVRFREAQAKNVTAYIRRGW